MIWLYLLIGITFTMGGWCLCCGLCLRCSDDTDTATIQVDVNGIAADQVDNTCCDDLNGTYVLSRNESSPCVFEISYTNGACTTAACSQCDSSGCTVGCDESPTKICDPSQSGGDCSTAGTVAYGGDCPTCAATEGASISLPEGSGLSGICTCGCNDSGLIWDTDVMLVDHPEVTWASPGDPVYYCNCSVAADCTTAVDSSAFSLTVTLSESGSDTLIGIGGNFQTRSVSGGPTITGSPLTCASDINGLVLTEGTDFTVGSCTGTCLCGKPTDLTLTFIP